MGDSKTGKPVNKRKKPASEPKNVSKTQATRKKGGVISDDDQYRPMTHDKAKSKKSSNSSNSFLNSIKFQMSRISDSKMYQKTSK